MGRTTTLCVRSLAATALAIFLLAGRAATGDGPGPSEAPVPLDVLLRLPAGTTFEVERVGGLTRAEWRARFAKHIRERDEAEAALADSRDKLSEIASKTAGWNLGTPGTGAGSVDPDTPLSFELNQKIRRQKRDLAEAEEALETLEVEANLAHVPEEWRRPEPEPIEQTAGSSDW